MLHCQKIVVLLWILVADSCTPQAGAKLLVTNGVKTSKFPEVVNIDISEGTCTGTFISQTLLITAAHCLSDQKKDYRIEDVAILQDPSEIGFYKDGSSALITPKAAIIKPEYLESSGADLDVNTWDMAVLVFATNVAPATAKLGTKSPSICDPVTIVGFGDDNMTPGTGSGTKRYGTNTVAGKISDGRIYITGVSKSTDGSGRKAGAGHGDSGGPLFWDDSLVGVAQMAVPHGDEMESYYGDLTIPAAQAFIAKAEARAASIPAPPPPSSGCCIQ